MIKHESRFDEVYFVLNGLLNGDLDEVAFPAGDGDDPQADGWYFIPPGSADGVGPYISRKHAIDAANQRNRFFVIRVGDGSRTEEIPEGAQYDEAEDHVVLVSPPDEKRHGARRYTLGCYYDDRGVWEFVSNMNLDDGLTVVRQALKVSP
jgi:hypothetical protein